MFDQPSADHRPDTGSDRAKARPSTDGASSFLLRKGTANDGKTAWNKERRAQPLKRAGGDQLTDIRSKSARGRRQREERNANHKNAATPVVIAERTPDEQEGREQE